MTPNNSRRKYRTLFLTLLFLFPISCLKKPTAWIPSSDYSFVHPVNDTVFTQFPNFIWTKGDAKIFWLQISSSSSFLYPLYSDSTLRDSFLTLPFPLEEGKYFIRLRGKREAQEPWGKWTNISWFYVSLNPFVLIASLYLPGYVRDMTLDSQICYIALGPSGLASLDLQNPRNPQIISIMDNPLQINTLNLWKIPNEPYLYLADDDGGVQVVLTQDPSNMTIVGNMFGRNIRDVTGLIRNDTPYIYVAREDQGLLIAQAYYRDYPILLRILPQLGNTYGVFIRDNLLFVCLGTRGLAIYDLNPDPVNPLLLSYVFTPGDARAAFSEENSNYLIVACKEKGVALVDISHPLNPIILDTLDLPGYAWDVISRNDTIYVASGGDGLVSLLIKDRTRLKILGKISTGYSYSVKLYNEFVLVGTRNEIKIVGWR